MFLFLCIVFSIRFMCMCFCCLECLFEVALCWVCLFPVLVVNAEDAGEARRRRGGGSGVA